MKKIELISFAAADELASDVARAWLDEIEKARRSETPYCVALSGGRITQKLFAAVVGQAKARKIGGRRHTVPSRQRAFLLGRRALCSTG
jgi:6-phosphogluconolactonase/glucosamine-6-phosphate isomerase/deaminase